MTTVPQKNILTRLEKESFQKNLPLWQEQKDRLEKKIPNLKILIPPEALTDIMTIYAPKESYQECLLFLKEQCGYHFLSDITATDELPRDLRFDVVVHLFHHEKRMRIRVKTQTNDSIPSLVPLFTGANWAEREVYDLFGITFEGHPDMRRIIMHESWQGHPLRKDYPLRGYQVYPEAKAPDKALLQGDDL